MHFHGHLPLLSGSTQSSGPSAAHRGFRPLSSSTCSGILTSPRNPPPRTHGGPSLLFSGPVLSSRWSCSLEWKPSPNRHTHTHTHTPLPAGLNSEVFRSPERGAPFSTESPPYTDLCEFRGKNQADWGIYKMISVLEELKV